MAYNKTIWENKPSTNSPVNANNMNKIEQGIYDSSLGVEKIGDITLLDTTDKTSVVNAINELVNKFTPVVLYNDTTGTTGNITDLSDNVSNYSYLEIFYKMTNTIQSTKISGNRASLIVHVTDTTSHETYIQFKEVSFSGTTMTVNSSQEWENNWGSTGITAGNTNNIKVIKILGYK